MEIGTRIFAENEVTGFPIVGTVIGTEPNRIQVRADDEFLPVDAETPFYIMSAEQWIVELLPGERSES